MADRPIIFSAPMVRALLDGRKTQTRRILKPQPVADVAGFERVFKEPPFFEARDAVGKPVERAFPYPKGFVSPYPRLAYAPGDRLYVREAFARDEEAAWEPQGRGVFYLATDIDAEADCNACGIPFRKQPSIHMPRWASRLTLTVTEVRVQPLEWIDITDDDCNFEAYALGFRYWIRIVGTLKLVVFRNACELGEFDDAEAAKAAAQADYEARIMAALDTPAPAMGELVEALKEGRRAIGDHFAPHDCYATGPLTGDPYRDLVQCPACSFIAAHDAVLAKIGGAA